MYSAAWFETFSATVSPQHIEREILGLDRVLPLPTFRDILDLGCGIGRIAGPLHGRGYRVTAVDVNVPALCEARRREPGPTYVALDQRHVGRPRWRFDAVVVLWNSLGYVSRDADRLMLRELALVLRPGGALVLDLYHPGWLERDHAHGLRSDAVTKRRVVSGRCFNEIQYVDGHVDRIEFEVYPPDEIRQVAEGAGFELVSQMVWWDAGITPGPDHARYQLVFRRSVS